MVAGRFKLGILLLAAVAAAACSGEPAPESPVAVESGAASSEVAAPESPAAARVPVPPQPSPEASEPPAVTAPPPPAESEPAPPPLSELLKLPDSLFPPEPGPRPTALDWEAPPGPAAAGSDPKALPPVGIEVDSRADPASADARTTHDQTDAAVAVDVDETTRIRGGVRVQEKDADSAPERIPTVGIEKRF